MPDGDFAVRVLLMLGTWACTTGRLGDVAIDHLMLRVLGIEVPDIREALPSRVTSRYATAGPKMG